MDFLRFKNYYQQQRQKFRQKELTPKRILTLIGLGFVALFLFGVLSFGILVAIVSIGLPDVHDLDKLSVAESTTIYDRESNVLYVKYGEENRQYVAYDQISSHVIDATVAIEDDKYWEHPGFNAMGILRAVITNLFNFGTEQGGSTITQQYIKATFLTAEKSYIRKLKELILAVQLEQAFDKKKILELYLNKIPYGNNAHGIEKAAQIYFNKNAKDLDILESAILSAIPQRPSYYNPYGSHLYSSLTKDFTDEEIVRRQINSEKDLKEEEFLRGLIGKSIPIGSSNIYIQGRADLVLGRMVKLGYISEQQYQDATAKLQKIDFKKRAEQINSPHFVEYIIDELEDKYGKEIVARGGLKVYTTLDPRLQAAAEKAAKEGAEANGKKYNAKNASLVAIDPTTGQILAMVGSRYYYDEAIEGKTNVATSYRQPGSSFKPIVYAQAFNNRYAPATVVYDTPIKLGATPPKNFDGSFRGRMTIRSALGQSRNIPAIKAYYAAGEQKPIIELAQNMGIHFQDPERDYSWTIALGSAEVRLLDMVSAFGVFANNGVRHNPVTILKVEDAQGNILEEWKPAEGEAALDPQVAYLINSILSDTTVRLSQNLTIPNQVNAAKTGTSTAKDRIHPHDLWAIGYTPKLVAGVWTGNNRDTEGNISTAADGINVAAPIWKKFMTEALKGTPSANFTMPEGIVKKTVSLASGKLPAPNTPPELLTEDVFASFSVPTEVDDSSVQVRVDTRTNEIATEFCPPELVKNVTYITVHDLTDNPSWIQSASDWLAAHKPTTSDSGEVVFGPPPTQTCTTHTAENFNQRPQITITTPTQGESVPSGSRLQVQVDPHSISEIAKVEFFLDGEFKYRTVTAPYDGIIRLPVGERAGEKHTVTAKVYDTIGYTGEASIEILTAEKTEKVEKE